jgi:tRNA modification GTPase
MYDVRHTIAAVSSAAGMDAVRTIIRISGPKAFELVSRLFETSVHQTAGRIAGGSIRIDDECALDVAAYIFGSPRSYTGDDLIELHIAAPSILIAAVMQRLFAMGIHHAVPGEFTARAYLNGKLDLAQAEAVAQIVTSGNLIQLMAAQKLLTGRLTDTIRKVQNKLLDLISRIEAGLDFSAEDIAFISTAEAIECIDDAVTDLEQLLDGSVSCEEVISLPSVGIVGAPNAGKSSLLNTLLGLQRSIVSAQRSTTRDVLNGILKLAHCNCAIFDCAGLLPAAAPQDILHQLAQDAAIEAAHTAQLVIFCVDVSKSSWAEDTEVFNFVTHQHLIAAATKCDLPKPDALGEKIAGMKAIFGRKFLPLSSHTGAGIESLRDAIDSALACPAGTVTQTADIISLNQRHRSWLKDAINWLGQAKQELLSGNPEVAAMLLRNGYRGFGELSDEGIDDAVLERIFSRFCIGK